MLLLQFDEYDTKLIFLCTTYRVKLTKQKCKSLILKGIPTIPVIDPFKKVMLWIALLFANKGSLQLSHLLIFYQQRCYLYHGLDYGINTVKLEPMYYIKYYAGSIDTQKITEKILYLDLQFVRGSNSGKIDVKLLKFLMSQKGQLLLLNFEQHRLYVIVQVSFDVLLKLIKQSLGFTQVFMNLFINYLKYRANIPNFECIPLKINFMFQFQRAIKFSNQLQIFYIQKSYGQINFA